MATNRFSKKGFNDTMKNIINDPSFTVKVANVKDGELTGFEEVAVTEGFRKFLKKVVEKAGIDKKESAVILDKEFRIDNVDGLYEFIAAALYQYMSEGNWFEFLQQDAFRGKITVKEKAPETRVRAVKNPQTKQSLGTWQYDTNARMVLVASNPTPKYLTTRKKISD